MSEPSPNGNGHHCNGLFAMVPLEIAARKDLSPGGKLLFGIIYSLEHAAKGKCTASNEELATRVGLSIKQIRRLLHDLEERQLIARTLEHGRRFEIRALCTSAQMPQIVPPGGPDSGPQAPQIWDPRGPPEFRAQRRQ